MPTESEVLTWLALIDEEEKERREREEAPKYDWYGPDCDCPAEGRKSDGSCRVHPRARPKQRIPEGEWDVWMVRSGRGFGKTRTGAEWIRHLAMHGPKNGQYAMVGAVASDVRDIMINGPSGILRISPPWFMPKHEPSKRCLTWPNGVKALCYSAETPRDFRGPAFHGAWCDEFAKWAHLEEGWDNLQFGMRQISDEFPDWEPKTCITTTPLPLPLIKELIRDPTTRVIDGSTYENEANLAKKFIRKIKAKYEGTRFGRQEIYGEILEDAPGALWDTDTIKDCQVDSADIPELARVVVSIDPSVSDPNVNPDRDTAECGITVGGMAYQMHPTLGEVAYGYTLADLSLKAHPNVWARAAVEAYHRHQADMIVAEVNNGGAMVASVIQSIDPSVPVKCLHASRGKHTRAEPIASFYEQGRIKHSRGADLAKLEDQMTSWVPGLKSPDRLDSLVWLHTELMTEGVPLTMGPHPFPGYRG